MCEVSTVSTDRLSRKLDVCRLKLSGSQQVESLEPCRFHYHQVATLI